MCKTYTCDFFTNETIILKSHFSVIWESVADAVPEHIALIQGTRQITWRDYEHRAAQLAQALLDAGLRKDSKVGMYLYNSPEYAETNFAALKSAACRSTSTIATSMKNSIIY